MPEISFWITAILIAAGAVVIAVIHVGIQARRQKEEIVDHRGMYSHMSLSSYEGLIGTPDELLVKQPVVCFKDGTCYPVTDVQGIKKFDGAEVKIVRAGRNRIIAKVVP